jgi:FXSXX-COOH protein
MATSTVPNGPAAVYSELIDLSTASLEAVRTRPDSALARAVRQVAEEGRTDAVKAARFNNKIS